MALMHPLISAEELADILSDVQVCDIRWDLTDPNRGRADYEAGHVPGAVFVHLDTDLASLPGIGGRHPLPDLDMFASTLARLGIDPGTHVVVYDDMGGRIAARMWWMLNSIGHSAVQLLDGGYREWVRSGGDVETGTVLLPPKSYPRPATYDGVVDHTDLEGRVVVDARAGERYRGETEPVDPKAGHIPGAIHIPTDRNLGDDGRFLPGHALSELYGDLPDDVVMSCGSGVTACHDAVAMALAGRPIPDVYVGSFSEWSRLDLPVNTGPTP